MPGTIIDNSPNIALLDQSILANLCSGLFYIDLTPSVYISTGNQNVQGATVQIKNSLGVIVKNYGSSFEISPALSGGMDAAITFPVPTISNGFQLGKYEVSVQLTDADGTIFTNTKYVSICAPDAAKPQSKFALLSAVLAGNCQDGKMSVIVDGVPNYKGTISASQVNDFTLEYPTGSGLPVEEYQYPNINVPLYEGVYKLTGTICATYNIGDNVFVSVLYKVKKEHNQKCIIDFCCVNDALIALNSKRLSDCTDEEKETTANTVLEVLLLLKNAELSAKCGEDPSDFITELEGLLGCKCTCNCNEGTPIINNTPTADAVIEGCGVTQQTVGLTTIYTIDNFTYVVDVNQNGGVITAADATVNGCVKTQRITYNAAIAYAQIKATASGDFNSWASIINKSLNGLDLTCCGYTAQQVALMTFKERIQAIASCSCSNQSTCNAMLSNVRVTQTGRDINFKWDEDNFTGSVDIYLDGVLQGTVLAGVMEYDAQVRLDVDFQHIYKLIPKCFNGSPGKIYEGIVDGGRSVFVAPPEIYTPYLMGICPYDITTNVLGLPLGITAEYHTANNTNASTLIADPTTSLQGTFWVFGVDSNGFHSEGVRMQVVCSPTGSCSAPQNLQVVPQFGSNQVKFQSAAYPPPMNSYTVKRRLTSDTDIPANYTTIGAPVWNASASRWVISDMTAVPNQLYTYRAISNCGVTNPYIDFDYAEISCLAISLTPKVTSIDYAFFPPSGAVTKVETTIYSDFGSTPVHTDTHNAAFASMVSGSMTYLNPNSVYYVRNRVFIGTYFKDCPLQSITTLKSESTLVIDYVAGMWMANLSNPLSQAITFGGDNEAYGCNSNTCSVIIETSIMPTLTINAGALSVSAQTDEVTYLSPYYRIFAGLTIVGIGLKSTGGTFNIGGTTVTLQVNHVACSFYPA